MKSKTEKNFDIENKHFQTDSRILVKLWDIMSKSWVKKSKFWDLKSKL